MKTIRSMWAGAVLSIALAIGAGPPASANPSLSASVGSTADRVIAESAEEAPVVQAAHKRRKARVRGKRRAQVKGTYRRHHRRFHRRYTATQKGYRRAHRKFHRHYGRKHRSPGVTIRVYPRYNPYYYNPYYYDPYYDTPYYGNTRLSCARVRALLHRHGYRHVRAYDCKGKVYGFYVRYGGRRYKVRASAYSGQVISRQRI